MKRKWIDKDDVWGIRRKVRDIYISYNKLPNSYSKREDLSFDAFFNQKLPLPWIESTSALMRHIEEIRELAQTHKENEIWIDKRNRTDLSCMNIDFNVKEKLVDKTFRLPLYEEIEDQKIKWQKMPTYKIKEGFSKEPIKEEYVQLVFKKRGGDNNEKE